MEFVNKLLTKRENQIAGLAACGLAKKEMADRLGTAYGTTMYFLTRPIKRLVQAN